MWIRVRVKNEGKSIARDVQIRIISVKKEHQESEENRPSWWFKISNLNATKLDIPPGFPQYFDVAFMVNRVGSTADLALYLAIVRPDDLRSWEDEKERIEQDEKNNRLEIGFNYTLTFALVSDNADAKYYKIDIKVFPRGKDDPAANELLGEAHLRRRLQVNSPIEVQLR